MCKRVNLSALQLRVPQNKTIANKLAANIFSVMKVIDPRISGKAFVTLAEKATQLIDMIDGTLANPESPALLASLLLHENQRAILVIFGVTVTPKTPAHDVLALLDAAIAEPGEQAADAPSEPVAEQGQVAEQGHVADPRAADTQAAAEQVEHGQVATPLAAPESANVELVHKLRQMEQQMQLQMQRHMEQRCQHEQQIQQMQQMLDMQQKSAMEAPPQQQQQTEKKRKRETTSTKKVGGNSRTSRNLRESRAMPVSTWAGSPVFREKKRSTRVPQRHVDEAETRCCTLAGRRRCAGGKITPLDAAAIGTNVFTELVEWFKAEKTESAYLKTASGTRPRSHRAVFSVIWYEGEWGTDQEGKREWQEVLFTDPEFEMTAKMMFDFNGMGGEPNDGGVHCAFIAAIKNAGVETSPFHESGQISYAPTDEELDLTAEFNPKYKRIVAKRTAAAPCLEID